MDVEVKLTGTVAARTGTHSARVGVDDDATVADVVDALADDLGPHVRAGVLEGSRLRTDTVVVRDATENEHLTAGSRLREGDTVRFSLAS
ncbi:MULTISPECIES: MoaD/ThiS family protein [Halobacterium]|uniref:MoaD/ThiS family protein n=1 Tax=Halobacterium TaxID=2239 RepID=UPI00073EBC4A|nr:MULTISPECIES: MoaD/ThiS family protein [Halobacterium]MCG1002319.1 MoaD/ThiS family protein [Halobacterium noricense]